MILLIQEQGAFAFIGLILYPSAEFEIFPL